jgi:hypothetical protein
MLSEALLHGYCHKGNHEILVTNGPDGPIAVFKYRGTPITTWLIGTEKITQDAHGYNTISTKTNQAKNERAIREYKAWVEQRVEYIREITEGEEEDDGRENH